MKAPARATRSTSRGRPRVRAQSAFIYRARKEVRPSGLRSRDFLSGRLGFPQQVALRLVSSEASRLAKSNRAKVISAEEINAAATLVQKALRSRTAA